MWLGRQYARPIHQLNELEARLVAFRMADRVVPQLPTVRVPKCATTASKALFLAEDAHLAAGGSGAVDSAGLAGRDLLLFGRAME